MTWKCFLHHRPFGWRIHRWSMYSHKMSVMESFGVFLVFSHKLLNKWSSCRWFESPWRPCVVIDFPPFNPSIPMISLYEECRMTYDIIIVANNSTVSTQWPEWFNVTIMSPESYYTVGIYLHYNDVIMGTIASRVTSLTIVYSTVYSDADQRKHQSPSSLAFVRGIHRGPVNSPHKWPVTRKMFPFDDVIMIQIKQNMFERIREINNPLAYMLLVGFCFTQW